MPRRAGKFAIDVVESTVDLRDNVVNIIERNGITKSFFEYQMKLVTRAASENPRLQLGRRFSDELDEMQNLFVFIRHL